MQGVQLCPPPPPPGEGLHANEDPHDATTRQNLAIELDRLRVPLYPVQWSPSGKLTGSKTRSHGRQTTSLFLSSLFSKSQETIVFSRPSHFFGVRMVCRWPVLSTLLAPALLVLQDASALPGPGLPPQPRPASVDAIARRQVDTNALRSGKRSYNWPRLAGQSPSVISSE